MHDASGEQQPRNDADDSTEEAGQAPGVFRRTLVRVMAVQVFTLLVLWFVQSWFG